MEVSICDFALRLACGAVYKNGTPPVTHIVCTSISDARSKMLSYGRPPTKPLSFLQWTTLKYINNSIKFTLDTSDKFYTNINTHKALIDEMRDIRNHIAHRTSSTSTKYYAQLNSLYGGNPKITVGAFLLSTIRNTPSNIEKYLLSVPVILHDISKG